MADPTTLLDYAQQRLDAVKAARTKASAAVKASGEARAQAVEAHAAATKALVALGKEIDTSRAQLAKVETTADGESLLRELERQTAQWRAQQAKLVSTERAVDLAHAQIERAEAELTQLKAEAQEASPTLAGETSADKRRAELKKALGIAPLAGLAAEAAKALDATPGAPAQKAKLRLENELPIELLARALERLHRSAALSGLVRASSASVRDLLTTGLEADGGPAAALARRERTLRSASEAVADHVQQAKARRDSALARLAQVADPTQTPLTPAQKARIGDAALKAVRENAAKAEKARDAAGLKVAECQAELDLAVRKARAKDVDADTTLDANVQQAKNKLDLARHELDVAVGVFKPELQQTLDAWEAAVPDSTWRLLHAYARARRELESLRDINPQDLVKALNDAEAALVAARLTRDRRARSTDWLAREETLAARTVAWLDQAEERQLYAALRGDATNTEFPI